MLPGLALGAGVLRAEGSGSAEVTEWPTRLGLTVAVLAVIGLALWGMWRGWQNRAARQQDIPSPPPEPADLGTVLLEPRPGVYLASTRSGDWLDRVVVHGLGTRSRAELSVADAGVLIRREGAPDVFVPRADLRGVRVDRGIAGAVYEQGGVAVVTWDLGGNLLDSGFRAQRTEDHVDVAAAVETLLRGDRTLTDPTEGAAP